MRTIDQMVQSEVLCCMSSIVSTLAQGYGGAIKPHSMGGKELEELCEQAAELASPIADYEEAAIQAGWSYDRIGGVYIQDGHHDDAGFTPADGSVDSWQTLCEVHGIKPYDREVFEHWAVTEWFADKLIAAGEKVDKDFAGLCVWARTTTGQAIYADGVIERIYKDTHK